MPDAVYSVAMITRGAGAFAYSYTGEVGLESGQVVAVPFQHRLELGLVVGLDPDPPQKAVLPLIPVAVRRWPYLGDLLLALCELSVSAPDEIAGHLLFDSARQSLRLNLSIEPDGGDSTTVAKIGHLAGQLKPTQQKLLAKQHWLALSDLARQGQAHLEAVVAGDPDATRVIGMLRKVFGLTSDQSAMLGISASESGFPASYMSGFDGLDIKALTAVKPGDQGAHIAAVESMESRLGPFLECDSKQILIRALDVSQEVIFRTTSTTWPRLRAQEGLLAEIAVEMKAERRILVVTPQGWMTDRLWPVLAPLAAYISKFRSEAGPGLASHLLRLLESGPHAVFGGPGAWKLAAYFPFDRIMLIDPTHPQYLPQHTPHLDTRLALLLAAQSSGTATVDFVNFGLDIFDRLPSASQTLEIHEPFEPAGQQIPAEALVDVDPLPLELRQPDKRRLVYYNRLGSGRGLHCTECWAAVTCPQCGSSRVHFSSSLAGFKCADCDYIDRELRCPRCNLMTLMSVLPGLESVQRRASDLVVHGPIRSDGYPKPPGSVIGTSQLLEPLPAYWPQQIIYVHAESRVGLLADWPLAVDMALRLSALYDNPELESVHIVSSRLSEQLGSKASPPVVREKLSDELELRELSGLPPHGTLYHLRAIAASSQILQQGRQLLGEALQAAEGTTLLRLGSSFRQSGTHRLAGWLVNPQLTLRDLQELRWQLHRLGVTLTVNALRGPWVLHS